MQKDPYIILGLTNEATKSEVESAYRNLRNEYSQLRFEEGEIGANASRKLGELDQAYADCMEDLKNKDIINDYGSSFGQIEKYIKERRLEQAQIELDSIDVRDGQWHYYQAQIFYHSNNKEGAKQQLEIALDLDPFNEKYKTALNRIISMTNGDRGPQPNYQRENNNQRAGYTRPNTEYSTHDNSSACCNTCQTLICLDCCCECMGGDLIPCC